MWDIRNMVEYECSKTMETTWELVLVGNPKALSSTGPRLAPVSRSHSHHLLSVWSTTLYPRFLNPKLLSTSWCWQGWTLATSGGPVDPLTTPSRLCALYRQTAHLWDWVPLWLQHYLPALVLPLVLGVPYSYYLSPQKSCLGLVATPDC